MEKKEKDSICLTPRQAVEAIRLDFERYPRQALVLKQLCTVIFGEASVLPDRRRNDGIWIRFPGEKKMRFKEYRELQHLLLDAIADDNLDAERLAMVVGCLFQQSARLMEDGRIKVETGMEGFSCKSCGRCCRELDYRTALKMDDYLLFVERKLEHVLKRIKVIYRGKKIETFRIWVDPETGEMEERCPWLEYEADKNRYRCRIYEVRPDVCRQYPGTRKHARMTGCPGFEKKREK